jgi:putative DNA primase/helicase
VPSMEVSGLTGAFGGLEELEQEPPVSWLIKNWLPSNEISILYGQGGTFKSYIALGWTMQVCLDVCPTLYIAAEGTSGLKSRVDAYLAARSVSEGDLENWHYFNAGFHLDNPLRVHQFINGLKHYIAPPGIGKRTKPKHDSDTSFYSPPVFSRKKPGLVIVDTLARNFSGDENSTKDMGALIEGCEYIKREVGCAVLIVHHMGVKTGRERGTGALRNASFAMYRTLDARYNETGGGSVKLQCDRMKDAPLPKDVRVYFDSVALDVQEHGEVHRMSQAMRRFPPRGREKPRKGVIKTTTGDE